MTVLPARAAGAAHEQMQIVFDNGKRCLECSFRLEGFPSGQRDQTVNLTALPSKVRILPPPTVYSCVLSREFAA